jgi:hypothetical protein
MKQTFLEWLEDFVSSIENPERPSGESEYRNGCYDTQTLIAAKLRFALEIEKVNQSHETEILS